MAMKWIKSNTHGALVVMGLQSDGGGEVDFFPFSRLLGTILI